MKQPIDILIEILKNGGSESGCPPDGHHDDCNLWELDGDICEGCWRDYAEMVAERENRRTRRRLMQLRLNGTAYFEDKLERRRWYRVRLTCEKRGDGR